MILGLAICGLNGRAKKMLVSTFISLRIAVVMNVVFLQLHKILAILAWKNLKRAEASVSSQALLVASGVDPRLVTSFE